MINIYTDSTVTKNHAIVTCFILSDKNFISCQTHKFNNVRGSVQGELLAIRFGIQISLSKVQDKDITIYTDSKEAIHHIVNNSTKSFGNIIRDIQDITKNVNVTYALIKGHASEHNPNKVVDLVSNSINRIT